MEMQKKKMVYSGTLADSQAVRRTETPMGTVCQLIYCLGAAFQETPEIYVPQNSCELWVAFPRAVVQCEDFLEDYGACLASLSPCCGVTLCGFADYLEEGELGVEPSEGETGGCGSGYLCIKKNSSGRDFDILSAVWLRICFSRKAEAEFTAQTARAISFESGAAAVCSRWADVFRERGLFEETGMSYFRYIFFCRSEDVGASMAASLSAEQMKELWISFLRDRRDAQEFEILYEKLDVIAEAQRNRLMTALRLALATLEIRVERGPDEFRVTDAQGARLRFDFASRTAAERLFLKLIFPAPER